MKDNIEKSIISLEEAVEWRQELRRQNKKLVVTNGCFDLLHRGHVEYLYESRKLGDALLVLVNSDASSRILKGEGRPLNDEISRAYVLSGLESVDRTVIFDCCDCHTELAALKPDIYVKGGDYTLDTLNKFEKNALLEAGSVICFKSFIKGFSTVNIIESAKKTLNIKDKKI